MNVIEYSKKYNEISSILLEQCAAEHKNENLVLSPLSLLIALAMTAEASAGETKREITNVFCGKHSYDEVLALLRDCLKQFTKSESVNSASAVIVDDEVKDSINSNFTERLQDLFAGRLFCSKDVVNEVNTWVRKETHGLIDNIADNSMRDMLISLLNAIVFEVEWADEYVDDDVKEKLFTNADGSSGEVSMLESLEDSYVENMLYKGFVKPYLGSEFSYMALLPKKKSNDISGKMLKNIDFTKLFQERRREKVSVYLPEYKDELTLDMERVLRKLGINKVFSDSADFSPLSSEWLKINQAIQKVKIEVDRKGTRAAVVSMMGFGVGGINISLNKPREVHLDRPFVYAIIHNETGLPVFTGIVNQITPLSEADIEMRKSAAEEKEELKQKYRAIARIVHPDVVNPQNESEAKDFERIWEEAHRAYAVNDLRKITRLEKELSAILGRREAKMT